MKYITGLINLLISLIVSTIIIYAINFIAGMAGADYSFANGEVFNLKVVNPKYKYLIINIIRNIKKPYIKG